MRGGEAHPAPAENGGRKVPGRVEERRDEGDEEAAKEMDEEGEKCTCCFSSRVLRLMEDVLLPRSAAWSYQPGVVGERRHDRGVPFSLDEAERDLEPSDLLRPMLCSTGVAGGEFVGDVFHSASALLTKFLDPVATKEETKVVASSSQLPTSAAGEGGTESWRRAEGADGDAGIERCAACIVAKLNLGIGLGSCTPLAMVSGVKKSRRDDLKAGTGTEIQGRRPKGDSSCKDEICFNGRTHPSANPRSPFMSDG